WAANVINISRHKLNPDISLTPLLKILLMNLKKQELVLLTQGLIIPLVATACHGSITGYLIKPGHPAPVILRGNISSRLQKFRIRVTVILTMLPFDSQMCYSGMRKHCMSQATALMLWYLLTV